MLKNKLKSWRHKVEMNQTEFRIFLGVNKDQYGRNSFDMLYKKLLWLEKRRKIN